MAYYVYEQKTDHSITLGIVSRKAEVPSGTVSTKAHSLTAARELIGVKSAKLAAIGFTRLCGSGPSDDVPFIQMWRRA